VHFRFAILFALTGSVSLLTIACVMLDGQALLATFLFAGAAVTRDTDLVLVLRERARVPLVLVAIPATSRNARLAASSERVRHLSHVSASLDTMDRSVTSLFTARLSFRAVTGRLFDTLLRERSVIWHQMVLSVLTLMVCTNLDPWELKPFPCRSHRQPSKSIC